jgi:DNA-binding transcriptional regulator LsrR (DeoR family)
VSERIPVSEQVTIVYAALQYLQHDRSTVEIAEELGVSRFKVGRMVSQARDLGLIEVVSNMSGPIDVELSRKLRQEFGLKDALVVVAASASDANSRHAIAAVTAAYLSDNVSEDSVLGIGPGRTIIGVCELIENMAVCDIVQLTGVATREPEESLQAIYKLSRASRGKTFPLHAPLLATTEQSAQAIVSQPSVQEALRRISKVDKAVLTIGGWPNSSLLADMLADSGELDALIGKGAVAEIGTTILDAKGRVVTELDSRTIGITTEQLNRVPYRIGLGGGIGKREAVLATLSSGIIDMVVTDADTARAVLDSAAK